MEGDGLLEREVVLAAADTGLERVAAGLGGALLVMGEAGTGKTSVLEAVADRAVAGGLVTVRARGEEMESLVPFGLLERLLADPALAVPGTTLAALEAEPSAPALHTLDLLRRREGPPLVLVLDDVHWADADSLRVIAFLARRLADLPVLVAAALRPWPPAAAGVAADLRAGGHAALVRVGALSRPAADALLTACAGAPVPGGVAARVWERCTGNPLLTASVGRALARGEDPLAGGTGADVDLVLGRFARLDDAALRFARCACLLGTSFRPEVAAEVAGLTDAEADHALEALHVAGVVTADGPRLRFVHPLIGEALYAGQVEAVRRRLHGRLSAALLRRGLRAEAAEQALRGDAPGDERTAALLEDVGSAAWRRGATEGAVRHLEAAVLARGDGAAPALRLQLARALSAVGRVADGAAVCEGVLREAALVWTERMEALTLLGRCRFLLEDVDRGAAELEEAVELAEHHDPSRAVRPLLEHSASIWMASGPRAAQPIAARAVRLSEGADPALREIALARWGSLTTEAGDPAGIAATLPVGRWLRTPARRAAVAPSDLVSPLAPLYPFAHCAQYDERFDDCVDALTLADERIASSGSAHAAALVQLFLGNHLIRRGDLAGTLRAADHADRYAEYTALTVPIATALRARAWTWMGRLHDGRAEAERALAAAPGAWLIEAWAGSAIGLGALWAGDPGASAAFVRVEDAMEGAGAREPGMLQWEAHAVAAHLLAGRVDHAERVATRIRDIAAGHPARWPAFAAELAAARIAEHHGAAREALDGYAAALERLGDVDLPLQRAQALLAGGSLRRRHEGPVAARPWLAEARRLAEAHGARPLADDARAELRLAGGRRRAIADRDRLTAAELRVARAAAEGRSNAEIAAVLHLSTNTVATHLRRVYAKLGISGRARLASVDLEQHA